MPDALKGFLWQLPSALCSPKLRQMGGGLLNVGHAPSHAVLEQCGDSLSLEVQHFVSFIEMVRYCSIKQSLGHRAPVHFHAWCRGCIYLVKNLSHSQETTPTSTTDGGMVNFPISEL